MNLACNTKENFFIPMKCLYSKWFFLCHKCDSFSTNFFIFRNFIIFSNENKRKFTLQILNTQKEKHFKVLFVTKYTTQ